MSTPIFKFAIYNHVVDCCSEKDIDPATFLPTKSEEKSSGWDVLCAEPGGLNLVPNRIYKLPLGIRTLAPDGWWLELRPRSSSFGKKDLHALYGVIDESYEGQLLFCCRYMPEQAGIPRHIDFGEKIGQLIPVKRQDMVVERISNEEFDKLAAERGFRRGEGGFGSTGS